MKKIILIIIISILAFSSSTALAQKKGDQKVIKKETKIEQPAVMKAEPIVEQSIVEQSVAKSVEPSSNEHSIIGLMFGSGPVVQFVLWILIALSVITWGIVISKITHVRTAKKESKEFDNIFWSSKNLSRIPVSYTHLTLPTICSV